MRTIFTEDNSSPVATIRTIAKPDIISSFEDMADYRLLMKKVGEVRGYVVIHLQFDMKVPPSADKRQAEENAMKLYRAVLAHINSRPFTNKYGRLEICKEETPGKTQIVRLQEALLRITRYHNMPSAIKASREKPGACVIETRMSRGVNMRCIHHSLTDEIQAQMRPINGEVTLSAQKYVFYVWRPNSVNLMEVGADIFRAEFKKEINSAFPFLDTNELNLRFDLMPEQSFISTEQPQ